MSKGTRSVAKLLTIKPPRTEFEKPVEVKPPELSALWTDFRILENGKSEWIVQCRCCGVRWALARKSPVHAGNILALMNHAEGHMSESIL